MRLRNFAIAVMMTGALAFPVTAAQPAPPQQCRFIGLRSFAGFNVGLSSNANETVLLSPVFRAPLAWNELVVSWNAITPPGAWLKVEVMGIYPDHSTKYYTMGVWSSDTNGNSCYSVTNQADADGTVNTDTLVLNRAGADTQYRLTLKAAAAGCK